MATVRATEAKLEVVFDGPATEGGFMNAEEFASSLLGIASACQRVNRLVNGSQASLAVNIQAEMRAACFSVDLTLVSGAAATLLPLVSATVQHIKSAKDVAEVLFLGDNSVLGMLLRLGGRSPKEIPHQVSQSGHVNMNFGDGNVIVLGPETWDALNDNPTRKSLKRTADALRDPGIDSIEIGPLDDGQLITKEDLASFTELDDSSSDATEEELVGVYEIDAPLFKSRNGWRLTDGNAQFTADIADDGFWSDVDLGYFTAAKGTQLRVRLLKTQHRRPRLKTEYSIIKVLEVIPPPPPPPRLL